METTIIYWGYMGYIGIMEKEMETTNNRVCKGGLGFNQQPQNGVDIWQGSNDFYTNLFTPLCNTPDLNALHYPAALPY